MDNKRTCDLLFPRELLVQRYWYAAQRRHLLLLQYQFPFVYDAEALKYIDYDLDVKVYPDMTYDLLDEDEYAEHKEQMSYPVVLDRILEQNVEHLLRWVRQRQGPFAPDFIDQWYERYLTYR